MAADFRMERFAVDLFRHLWVNCDFEKSILARPKDYGDETKYDCTSTMIHAVFCRYRLYVGLIGSSLQKSYDQYSRNGIDFYYFLRKHMQDYMPYPNMYIFDRLFMTCAIVAGMSFYCCNKKNDIYQYVTPLCWAMYFETEFKKEFYDAGGWKELAKYAEVYNVKPLQTQNLFPVWRSEDFDTLHYNASLDCRLEEIVQHFKLKQSNGAEISFCLKCQPLFNVLYFRGFANDEELCEQDFSAILEGYIQIFIRMISFEKIEAIEKKAYNNVFHSMVKQEMDPLAERSFLMTAVDDIQNITTTVLLKNLFVGDNSLSPEKLDNERCLFCGEDSEKKPVIQNTQIVDSDKIESVKFAICETVSEVKSSETADPVPRITEFDEIEERMVLRLFLTIGIASAFNKMLANINEELGSPNNGNDQCATSSVATSKIQDMSTENVTKKKKKKKKKSKVDETRV